MAGITSLGMGSGIDIRTIVDGLVAAERQPAEFQLTKKETQLQAKLSSFGTFKSALSDFRSSLAGLRDSSKFTALQATSSNSEVITASVGSNADTGKFNLESKQLAQSHSLVTAGYSDANATVGNGTMTIKFGTTDFDAETETYNGFTQNSEQGALTLNIDSSNNTLTGLRDAINESKAGVSASIIYDGSAYRLVLSSEKTGAANSMEISIDNSSLSQFEFNATASTMKQTQGAQDAIMSINGLDVTSSTDTFKDTLKGVTIDLAQAKPGQKISLDIAHSSTTVVESLQGFIDSFNELNAGVKELSSYNAETKTASTLLGDVTLRSGMSQIRSVLSSVVSGLERSSARTLVDLGISTQADGTLKFDDTKFKKAFESDPENVAAVFAAIGRADNENVQVISDASTTPAGQYAVEITQAAAKGSLSGANNSIQSLVVTEGNNDTFKIKIDGVQSGLISLTAGTYNSENELAAEIQAKINGDSAMKANSSKVQVSYDSDNNRFVIKSNKYGADSNVEITQSSAGALGMGVAAGVAGKDVVGTIGGVEAEGKGQNLTAANGLKLFIDGSETGSMGNVTFSKGLMERLDKVLGGLLDSDGSLTAKTEGLQKSLDEISDERISLDDKIFKFEERLLSRFNAMDALLGEIQGTGAFLSQQLASLPYNNLSRNR